MSKIPVGELTRRRQEFVDRLRDGSFQQGEGQLQQRSVDGNSEKHCCLGVCTVLTMRAMPGVIKTNGALGASRTTVFLAVDRPDSSVLYVSSTGLIKPVIDYYGFKPDYMGDYGTFRDGELVVDGTSYGSLIDMNDSGNCSFVVIADAIVSMQDVLFVPDGANLIH